MKNFKHRNALTRLRISNHDLEIKKGRCVKGYREPKKGSVSIVLVLLKTRELPYLLSSVLSTTLRAELLNIDFSTNNYYSSLSNYDLFLLLLDPPSDLQVAVAIKEANFKLG